MFGSSNDNTYALANVRHILAAFEGGTTDPNTGATTYTDEEKAAAKAAAEELFNEWKSGAANEESFAALAESLREKKTGFSPVVYGDLFFLPIFLFFVKIYGWKTKNLREYIDIVIVM